MAIDFITTLSVLLTLMIWSYFIKGSSIIYDIAITIFGSTSIGYLAVEALNNIWYRNVIPLNKGDYTQLLSLALAIMMFFGYYKKLNFVARYPSAIGVAMNLGSTAAGAIIAQIYRQIIVPVNTMDAAVAAIIVILIMVYFTSTFKALEKKPLNYISTIGRYFLMIAFGFTFGSGLLTGYSGLLERIQYMFWTWLGLR